LFVVGLVGPFGSGCSYVAKLIEESKDYTRLSLSDVLRKLFIKEHPNDLITRSALQDFGNEIRKIHGNEYLAIQIWDTINEDINKNYVIDSIRNPDEVKYFRSQYTDFYLFGIFAEPEIRWKRVSNVYSDNHGEFTKDDKRDSGEKDKYGQQVTNTFRMSDIIILNNEDFHKGNQKHNDFCSLIAEKINIIEHKIPFRPNAVETYMTMAYASSMRSSCLKRKVGSVIVDNSGNVFSSGYNEVPSTQLSCLSEYNECYRDKLKKEFKINVEAIVHDKSEQSSVYDKFKESFKILDYCRSLHAEENAILNVARIGTSSALTKSVLYTTTYPCNLCAIKIAQVGIPAIVYFEPYPMEEAKKTLQKHSVKQIPFEGVTFNGYFRFMEEIE
jgi:deoxycytidylate deaminase